MYKLQKSNCRSFTLAAALLITTGAAQASSVALFTNINDANSSPSGFSVSSPTFSGNTYNIDVTGFNTSASGALGTQVIADTIAFDITAPIGYYISSISYSEGLSSSINGSVGVTTASGTAVINGQSIDMGSHIWTTGIHTAGLFTGSVAIAGQMNMVSMSITNVLSAISAGSISTEIGKTSSSVSVELTAVPLPAAFWLFGSSLLGMGIIGQSRKKQTSA